MFEGSNMAAAGAYIGPKGAVVLEPPKNKATTSPKTASSGTKRGHAGAVRHGLASSMFLEFIPVHRPPIADRVKTLAAEMIADLKMELAIWTGSLQ